MVGTARLELATPRSQSECATNCATSRICFNVSCFFWIWQVENNRLIMKNKIFLFLGVAAFQGLVGMDRVRQLHRPCTGSCPELTDAGRDEAKKRILLNARVLCGVEHFMEVQMRRLECLRRLERDDTTINELDMEELNPFERDANEK